MKKFLFFSLLIVSFWAFSQNPLLFDKNWKIEKVTVDNTVIDVSNEEIAYFIKFNLDGYFYNYYSKICTENYGIINYSSNSEDFTITVANIAGFDSCPTDDFDYNYSLFFQKNAADINKITYNIEQISTKYKLTLTNFSGDQVIYSYYTPPENLISKTWYLSSLDLGTYHYDNLDPQNHIGITNFTPANTIEAQYVTAGHGDIGFSAENKFRLINYSMLGSFPSGNPYIDQFDNFYTQYFLTDFGNPYAYPFSYEISPDQKTLKITNYNGDIATYSDTFMGTDETGKAEYKIYPNPASDFITIENLKPNSTLELFDNSGKMLKNISNNQSAKTEISIKDLPSGVYYLKINGQPTQKIIKK